jgi:hypothetical protein
LSAGEVSACVTGIGSTLAFFQVIIQLHIRVGGYVFIDFGSRIVLTVIIHDDHFIPLFVYILFVQAVYGLYNIGFPVI